MYAEIDTHADTHHLAVINEHGHTLEDVRVEATTRGYAEVLALLATWASVVAVGVEFTGSYGAGVARVLIDAGYEVREVNRPNRFDRRARGKTDVFDAYSAAEAVLSGRATAAPKGGDGLVEALRVLRTSRSSALRERTPTINEIKAMLIAGPEALRTRYRGVVEPQADDRAGDLLAARATGDGAGSHRLLPADPGPPVPDAQRAGHRTESSAGAAAR